MRDFFFLCCHLQTNHTAPRMRDRVGCLMRQHQLVEVLVPYLARKTSAPQQALPKHLSLQTRRWNHNNPYRVTWQMIRACYSSTSASWCSWLHTFQWNANLLTAQVQHSVKYPHIPVWALPSANWRKKKGWVTCQSMEVYLKKQLNTSGRDSSRQLRGGRRAAKPVTLQSSL